MSKSCIDLSGLSAKQGSATIIIHLFSLSVNQIMIVPKNMKQSHLYLTDIVVFTLILNLLKMVSLLDKDFGNKFY